MKRVGVLVTHGTDTLAWSLPYVRYAIKNNHANIALTGSQIPLPMKASFSDAFLNLENSIRFLASLEPPHIFAVFNYGRDAFSDSLRKVDRWDCEAFCGDRIAQMKFNDIRQHDLSVRVAEVDAIDHLHVISTGGTIDASADESGFLKPSGDHALKYIVDQFGASLRKISRVPAMNIDSSDMTFDRLGDLARKIVESLNEDFGDTWVEERFDASVRIVYCDPLKTVADYRREIGDARGVIVAGYGGANINIEEGSEYSPLALIRELMDDLRPVVITSQVPLGTADFVYTNGARPIQLGAIPGVDLSIPECQVRLGFLLGRWDSLVEEAGSPEAAFRRLKEIFLSGVKFRNRESRRLFMGMTGLEVGERDGMVG